MDSADSPQAPRVDTALLAEPGHAASLSFFRHLFEREISYVWSSLGRLGVPERDREDLAHEVFFRVYQRIDHYDPSRPIRPWLFAFTVRVAAEDRRRARHRYEELGGVNDAAALAVTPEGASKGDTEIITAALRNLDMDKRATLVLHDLDGHTVPEIALALGIPEGTVYSRLRAARAELTVAVRRQQRKER
jgi:RNA polymerase sigma-70 factor, ECF subfamily